MRPSPPACRFRPRVRARRRRGGWRRPAGRHRPKAAASRTAATGAAPRSAASGKAQALRGSPTCGAWRRVRPTPARPHGAWRGRSAGRTAPAPPPPPRRRPSRPRRRRNRTHRRRRSSPRAASGHRGGGRPPGSAAGCGQRSATRWVSRGPRLAAWRWRVRGRRRAGARTRPAPDGRRAWGQAPVTGVCEGLRRSAAGCHSRATPGRPP